MANKMPGLLSCDIKNEPNWNSLSLKNNSRFLLHPLIRPSGVSCFFTRASMYSDNTFGSASELQRQWQKTYPNDGEANSDKKVGHVGSKGWCWSPFLKQDKQCHGYVVSAFYSVPVIQISQHVHVTSIQ